MWREETEGQGKDAKGGITVRFDIMYWANLTKDFSGSYWAWCRRCDVTSEYIRVKIILNQKLKYEGKNKTDLCLNEMPFGVST